MKTKLKWKVRMLLAIALAFLLTIPVAALAGEEARAELQAYWRIVGQGADSSVLARAMSGKAVPLAELTQVTGGELLAFAAQYRLPVDMARHAWYMAMVQALEATEQDAPLSLFLSLPQTRRDAAANAERRGIRRALTEAEVCRLSEESGLPGGFVAWLLLEDEWYEDDWEDVADWREGRAAWVFVDHAYARDMRETYGKSAVVTEDDVERTLRQNGVRIDD